MLGKIHPDEVDVDNLTFAAFISYLGYKVMKVTHSPSGHTVFKFVIPECDFDILREEFEGDTPLLCPKNIGDIVSAFKNVQKFQRLAQDRSGEFISPEWRDIIYAR